MKMKLVVVLTLVIMILPCMVLGENTPWDKKLPFENATIHYTLSGMEIGEETLYIKNYGLESARYRTTKTSMLGMIMENRSVEIMTPDWIYHFDLQEGSGTKSVNPQKLMIEEYNNLSAVEKERVLKNAEEMGASIMSGMQGSLEKNVKEILGYSCDKITVMGSTIYSIHDTPVALHSESNIMGISIKSIATSFDKESAPDNFFEYPAGIEPLPDPEADQVAKMMAEQSMAMLRNPEEFKEKNKGNMMKMVPGKADSIPPEEQKQVEEAMKALKELFGN